MGVDYRVWLVPKDRAFKPNAEQIAALANALREGGWVPQPDAAAQRSNLLELLPGGGLIEGKPFRSEPFQETRFEPSWVAFHSDHELVFEWWVNDATQSHVQFPFTFVPYPESGFTYFGVSLIIGPEYFYEMADNVMPFPESETQCHCGEQLAYETDDLSGLPPHRIRPKCPKCGGAFDVSKASAEIMDVFTGERRSVAGGLAFRFSLQIDAHKNFPSEEAEFRRYQLKDGIHALWRAHIATPYEIIDTASGWTIPLESWSPVES
jgi:hypothetical protein